MVKSKRIKKIVSIVDLLDDIISEYNLEKLFTIESIKALWSELVGDIISTHSMPDRLLRGILYINADHSVYSNEIIMMKDQILLNIKARFRNTDITDLRVAVKKQIWK
jgi:predicted nucleic acid-binding Zn ribbon protein